MPLTRGEQFEMIIFNPVFPPAPDDSRHDVHFGEAAVLAMDVLHTIVPEPDIHPQILEIALDRHQRGGRSSPLSEPPTPAKQALSGNIQRLINPLRLHFKILTHLMFPSAAFVPC
jgi:hypothetical protein